MTAATQTLADFLLARIAEDEADAHNWLRFEVRDGIPGNYTIPDRVLAECEAKRQIVGVVSEFERRAPEWGDEFPAVSALVAYPLRVLASVYADHPDYRDEWKP